MSAEQWTIRPVGPVETAVLRHQVLRPHQRLDEMWLPGDDDMRSGHFAAFDRAGVLVGTISVLPESPAARIDRRGLEKWWRLRGMAVAPEWRGRGIGGDLMTAALGHLRADSAEGLWCNARLSARGFYERCGFSAVGEVWQEPDIGLHVKMWRLAAT